MGNDEFYSCKSIENKNPKRVNIYIQSLLSVLYQITSVLKHFLGREQKLQHASSPWLWE